MRTDQYGQCYVTLGGESGSRGTTLYMYGRLLYSPAGIDVKTFFLLYYFIDRRVI